MTMAAASRPTAAAVLHADFALQSPDFVRSSRARQSPAYRAPEHSKWLRVRAPFCESIRRVEANFGVSLLDSALGSASRRPSRPACPQLSRGTLQKLLRSAVHQSDAASRPVVINPLLMD